MSALSSDLGASEAAVRLHVATDLCPQVVLRVLGVVSRQSAIPHSVCAIRGDDQLTVEIALDGLTGATLERMRAQMTAIVGVRSVLERH